MTQVRSGGTRERIAATAMQLFAVQGVEKTSLREIAERLGITKAALYYHFRSKEDLVRSLVDPFLAEVEELLVQTEAGATGGPAQPPDPAAVRAFLGTYFDLFIRHRGLLQLLLRDLSAFTKLGLERRILGWQLRLRHLVVGPDAGPAEQVRAVLALGGLQDVAALLTEVPPEQARAVAIAAACAALGID